MAQLVPFRPLQTQDRQLTLIQSNIASSLNPVTSCSLLNGQSFSVTFSAANTDVTVKAGGTFLVGGQTAAGSVYISPNNSIQAMNPSPSSTTLLRASAPMTATLWFFQS